MASGLINHQRSIARVGERHGRIVVSKWLYSNKHRRSVFECVCDCGVVCVKSSIGLTDQASCGCWGRERQAEGKLRHGHSRRSGASGLYHSWQAMMSRCTNPNNQDFKWYGGKGITVWVEWTEFEGFNRDMGATWFVGATIDRIDSDGNYNASNCRWIPRADNARRSANARHTRNAEARNG